MTAELPDIESIKRMLSQFTDAELQELQQQVAPVMGQPFIATPGPQLNALVSSADLLLYGGAAGGGKALAVQTPIFTAAGWRTMGELAPGDVVFDPYGEPCTVTAKSEIDWHATTYRIIFADGSEIVADERHEWPLGRWPGTYTTRLLAELVAIGPVPLIASGRPQLDNSLICKGKSPDAQRPGPLADDERLSASSERSEPGSGNDPAEKKSPTVGRDRIGGMARLDGTIKDGPLFTTGANDPLYRHIHEAFRPLLRPPAYILGKPRNRRKIEPPKNFQTHIIVDVVRTHTRIPVQCISVDSPSRCYLAGKSLVPTHNSALEVGCAVLEHKNGIIFRREATQLDGLVEFSYEVMAGIEDANFNQVEKTWTWGPKGPSQKRLKFAGLPQVQDWRKHAGNARDYMAFDEAGEFEKEQIFSLLAWLRTTDPNQRTRVILGSNPPRGGSGEWMVTEFAPWLDDTFPDPAQPGELRWAIVVKGETQWVDGPGVYEVEFEKYEALSRTYIPAKLDDNPYLKNTGYRAHVQSLPEPLRSQLLHGDFTAGRVDHEWQVIPSDWVKQAQKRWTENPPPDVPMTAVAADIAQGGRDKTQIQNRYDFWYSPFTSHPGESTPDGPATAAKIVPHIRDHARVVVDAGGGYGGDTMTQLAHTNIDVLGFDGSRRSRARSRDNMFSFENARAQVVWQFREALDPAYNPTIALPVDSELLADLCAFRYDFKENKFGKSIVICPKDDMRQRLGRSPDKGDTTLMLFASHSDLMKRPKAAEDRRRNTRQLQQKAIMRQAYRPRHANPTSKQKESARTSRNSRYTKRT